MLEGAQLLLCLGLKTGTFYDSDLLRILGSFQVPTRLFGILTLLFSRLRRSLLWSATPSPPLKVHLPERGSRNLPEPEACAPDRQCARQGAVDGWFLAHSF